VDEPGPGDFIICGVPRSGTTLLTAMLFQPPGVVTVMEPWDGMRLPPRDLFASVRREIDTSSRLARGKLDVELLRREGEVKWRREGLRAVDLGHLHENYSLGIKWPAFWRYLELLPNTRFLICVRHPAEVVNSFKEQTGGLREGQMYDVAFNRALNAELAAATDDPELRRVLLYAYISQGVRPFLSAPNVHLVRYERWFDDPRSVMDGIASFLKVPLPDLPVRLRPRRSPVEISDREVRFLRTHARVAEEFGYDLDQSVSP